MREKSTDVRRVILLKLLILLMKSKSVVVVNTSAFRTAPKGKTMNVPTWVYEIWHGKARRRDTLRTLPRRGNDPGDGERLAALIETWKEKASEEVIKDAWLTFIHDDGTVWFSGGDLVEAPVVAVKRKFADGNEKIYETQDTSQITKFPFRAFLAVAEGYIVRALAAKK